MLIVDLPRVIQILKETSGTEGMNVRVRKSEDYNRLTEGIIVNDNIVKVLLKDLYLSNLDKPYLKDPEVSFDLGSHVLSMESKVSRMFITAEYQLFRNLSDVTYSSLGYENSPFNLQKVQNEGEVTIVAEDCLLTGLTIATLHGDTVNLGHDSFKLRDCRFSVEITTPGLGSPPVIAPYFSEQQGMELELLLIRPIRGELMPKLQGAVYTYVNTSAMFGELLPKIRNGQNKLFKTVGQFMTYVTRYVNQMTVTKDGGIVKWEDVTISWNDKHEGQLQEHKVVLRDMVVSGLDSAYSAQKGGPYIKSFVKIDDTVRFSALQIRGVLSFSIGSAQSEYVFYGEVQDIASYVSIGVALRSKQTKDKNIELKPFKSLASFEVTGWRNLDLHAPVVPKISPRALISGVILKELPHLIIQRLSRVFSEAVSDADKKIKTNTCFLALCIG
ncbi:uncharacterized protein LOC114358568 [Ostrinia furnacalis]|uniref:uncharacterized protein LOC114358568 n=1 Tax=Ostrinia furnacalis TaxID=93504 RepID=UPI001038810A|nr:uncharacterized protein LOC114358568 [Ostrinia furnacalis]